VLDIHSPLARAINKSLIHLPCWHVAQDSDARAPGGSSIEKEFAPGRLGPANAHSVSVLDTLLNLDVHTARRNINIVRFAVRAHPKTT
jgi:hypothetical protein